MNALEINAETREPECSKEEGSSPGQLITDPHIWKKSGLPFPEFLKRAKKLHKVRRRQLNLPQESTTMPVFSYLPRTLEAWGRLEQLHNLVNAGDFSAFDDDYYTIVAIVLAPKLSQWLLNTNNTTVQLQVINWLAAWLTCHSDLPCKKTNCLPSGINERVESIRQKHYAGQKFCHDAIWISHETVLAFIRHYEAVSKSISGAAPPEILKLRNCDLARIPITDWGLGTGDDGWIGFDFHYDYLYIRADDWERYILKDESTEDDAAESDEALRQQWLYTLDLYPTRKSHLFKAVISEAKTGFIYLLRGELLGHYKIGFTRGPDPYARQATLQTGACERLAQAGYFSTSDMKTEAVIKKLFASKRVRADGEWFALSDADVSNLLDEEWRIKNNIF